MTLRDPSPRVPTGRRLGVGVALAAMIVATSSPTWAKPEFPGIVQTTLELGCAPPCTICHTTPTPVNDSTATQPFVNNVILAGPGTSEVTLGQSLTVLETQICTNTDDKSCTGGVCTKPCDADGDGTGDIAELRNGTNPNNSGSLPCPEYGCFARVAPAPPKRKLDGTALLAALGTAIVLAGRWRRRSRC